jgi:hypothetical protein
VVLQPHLGDDQLSPNFLMRVLKSISKQVVLVFWILKAIVCVRSFPRVKFSEPIFQCVGSSCCLVAGILVELWKWHRRIGHLSFDLLSHLSGLGLVRGLPKLKYQKDLVCAPCRHGKMVADSYPPLTSVMTERP